MNAQQTARLAALPDTLRAWARENALVKLHLGQHVTRGLPLGHCLARLGAALGEEGDWQVRQRLLAGVHCEKFWPWCSRELEDGLRCRLLTTQLVQRAGGGAVECCDECADWYEAHNRGHVVRAVVAR